MDCIIVVFGQGITKGLWFQDVEFLASFHTTFLESCGGSYDMAIIHMSLNLWWMYGGKAMACCQWKPFTMINLFCGCPVLWSQ